MAEWFGNFLLVNILFLSFGIWGVRTLLTKHPILGKGLMRLARRFFF
jgi:hypothetical protein